MPLLLTSNGLKGSISTAVLPLLKKPAAECKVAFITTAAYGEEDNPQWFDKYRQEFRNLGITNIEDVDLRGKTQEEVEKILADKDIVSVNGGNTFYLLKYVRESGFEEVIKIFLDKGKLYIGISAGSIICCPTIETAYYSPADENTVELTDLKGLGLVPFLLSPHYELALQEIQRKEAAQTKYPVVALTNMQAILVTDTQVKLVGGGEKVVLNNLPENSISA